MTKKRIVRSILSGFLSLIIITNGFLPGMPFVSTVHAESTTKTITPGTDDAKTGTGTMEISLTIKKTPGARDFTFTSPTSLIYDGQAKAATVSAEAEGMGEVTVEYYNGDTKLSGAPTAEGTYTVKVNVAEGDDYKAATGITDDDWTFTILPMQQTMTITLEIASASVKTAPTANTLKYNGSAQELVTAGEANVGTMQYQIGESATTAPTGTWSDTVPKGKNAGPYYVWYRAYVGEENFTDAECVTASIAKRSVTLTSATATKAYDGTALTNTNVTVGGDGFVTGEGINYIVTGTQTLPGNSKNTFDYALKTGTSAGNYEITKIEGTLTVTTSAQTITASDVTATYGDTDKSVSASVTDPTEGGGAISYAVKEGSEDYIDVDASTGALTIKKVPSDGKAYVVVTAEETSTYTSATKDVTVTIAKKDVTVTADDKSMGYGKTEPELTATVTGAVSGDTVNFTLTRAEGSEVGEYVITVTAGENPNYNVTVVNGKFTINKCGWYKEDGNWYLYDENGKKVTGFAEDEGKTYYMDETGIMQTGWVKVESSWYYFNNSGTMLTGWRQVNNNWYYLDPETGAMATGWLEDDGEWYYLNTSGAMLTGWRQVNNNWYYLDPETGAMVTGWFEEEGEWYYLDSKSGAMATGWKDIDGRWYCFENSGVMRSGWIMGSDGWYYLAPTGAMQTGWQKVDGNWYYLASSGEMLTGWLEDGGEWYYLSSSGAMATEWQKIEGDWYWFGTNGAMVYSTSVNVNGTTYNFNDKGVCTNP